MKKGKRLIAMASAALMMLAMGGCGNSASDSEVSNSAVESTASDSASESTVSNSGEESNVSEPAGPVSITIGNWPAETNAEALELKEKQKAEFEEQNQGVEVIPDTYRFEIQTFTAKATAGQLPDLLSNLPYTEAKTVIKNGYAADITDLAKEYGLLDAINPDVLDLCTDEEGRFYLLPNGVETPGIAINKELFRQAGLVNEDGTMMIPDTFEEVAEFASIVKEKTGVAGFVMPTTGNQGGWRFTNIAWNYGVEFEVQNEDGSWTATFDCPEFHEALQWLYDMKWTRKVLQDDMNVGGTEQQSIFGTGRAAMMFGSSAGAWTNRLVQNSGMERENLALGKMPAGPAGRYGQLGGTLQMISSNTTPEQREAIFKWLLYQNYTPEIDEETFVEDLEMRTESGNFIFAKELTSIWDLEERSETIARLSEPYVNVDMRDFETYNTEGVTLRTEPPACCQELYATLDGVVQEVLTNENVDIPAISKKAQEDFQVNYLDKMD